MEVALEDFDRPIDELGDDDEEVTIEVDDDDAGFDEAFADDPQPTVTAPLDMKVPAATPEPFDAPEDELVAAFRTAAEVPIVKGFAVGRTIFGSAAQSWLAGEESCGPLEDGGVSSQGAPEP